MRLHMDMGSLTWCACDERMCVMVNGVCVLVGHFVLTHCWFASP